MLRTRVLTAIILIPLVAAGLLWLPTVYVGIVLGLLLAIGAWEWSRLAGWQRVGKRCAYLLIYILLIVEAGWHFNKLTFSPTPLLVLSSLWWLVAITWLKRFPRGWTYSIGRPIVGGLIGLVVLWAAVLALVQVHQLYYGGVWVLIFFALIWGADSGAYFAGRSLGRHKLAPNISPGKTIEGGLGGLVSALVIALICGYFMGFTDSRLLLFVGLGVWVALISMVGDLTVSMFKRQAGVKDSGRIFPGHGGVLDRLDSTLAGAPFFALGLIWLLQA